MSSSGAGGAAKMATRSSSSSSSSSSSAAAAAVESARNGAAAVSGDVVRMAAKRAATDDSRVASGCAVSTSKKRPALANLSNSSNVPPTRPAATKSRSRPRGARVEKKATSLRASGISSIPEGNAATQVECVSPVPSSTPTTVASLERKTEQSLYITKQAKKSRGADTFPNKEVSASEAGYKDIDRDEKDPQMCGLYATDIYQHLRMTELKRRPSTNFMEVLQQDVTANMRGILVDWLVEVAEEYKLVPDTLYLTVSFIDRFLSNNVVNRQRLQLLGVSCMLIAAKYEEICAPQVEEFCYITDNTYQREELLEMERQVLNNLRFELTTPTIKTFIRRFMRAAQASYKSPSLQLEFLGNYLSELCLVEYSFLKYMPSMIAASAVFLASLTHDPEARPWSATLEHYTGYKASELKECIFEIYDLQRNVKGCGLPAVREKYRQHKFKCVASLPAPESLPPRLFEDD